MAMVLVLMLTSRRRRVLTTCHLRCMGIGGRIVGEQDMQQYVDIRRVLFANNWVPLETAR